MLNFAFLSTCCNFVFISTYPHDMLSLITVLKMQEYRQSIYLIMLIQKEKRQDKNARITLSLLQEILQGYSPRDFAVRLWNGAVWDAERGMPCRFTLVINHPAVLRRMLQEPRELSLGECYLHNDIDIEGDLSAVFGLADHLIDRKWSLRQRLRFWMRLLRLPAPDRERRRASKDVCLEGECHSRERDRQAISYHYDVSNDFYALWLDRDMVYSCAYFSGPDEDLDTAQQRKLDYLCRKLRLRQGERLFDIGCGWGALLVHAVRDYGVNARGITLSRAQAEHAKERIRKEGLEGRCSVEFCDYRDVAESGEFDKLVSVGMFEHVGRSRLAEYFRKAWKLLRPGGLFLNHGIAMNPLTQARQGLSFSDRYVFPDGDLLPISTTLQTAETTGFEVRDVESLREHYSLTLRHWVRRLETHAAEACSYTDKITCRIWRLYMAGSAYGFETGRLNVYQALLVKPDNGASGLPLTRSDWYRPSPAEEGPA
jgi:cyclopropane-fatty-acyl-phospholipid synthase